MQMVLLISVLFYTHAGAILTDISISRYVSTPDSRFTNSSIGAFNETSTYENGDDFAEAMQDSDISYSDNYLSATAYGSADSSSTSYAAVSSFYLRFYTDTDIQYSLVSNQVDGSRDTIFLFNPSDPETIIYDRSNSLIEKSGILSPGTYSFQTIVDTRQNIFGTYDLASFSVTPVPIPSTLLLMGSGLVGLVGIGRKRLGK